MYGVWEPLLGNCQLTADEDEFCGNGVGMCSLLGDAMLALHANNKRGVPQSLNLGLKSEPDKSIGSSLVALGR